jgi:hypothetical protein
MLTARRDLRTCRRAAPVKGVDLLSEAKRNGAGFNMKGDSLLQGVAI